MKISKQEIKEKAKKVLPTKLSLEVEGPPLKVRGRADWDRLPAGVRSMERMPGHVREAERRR